MPLRRQLDRMKPPEPPAVEVPPTSQNQEAIEADLREFVQAHLDLDVAELTHRCEQAIRNSDPCISCSAHFLDLTVERSFSSAVVTAQMTRAAMTSTACRRMAVYSRAWHWCDFQSFMGLVHLVGSSYGARP